MSGAGLRVGACAKLDIANEEAERNGQQAHPCAITTRSPALAEMSCPTTCKFSPASATDGTNSRLPCPLPPSAGAATAMALGLQTRSGREQAVYVGGSTRVDHVKNQRPEMAMSRKSAQPTSRPLVPAARLHLLTKGTCSAAAPQQRAARASGNRAIGMVLNDVREEGFGEAERYETWPPGTSMAVALQRYGSTSG